MCACTHLWETERTGFLSQSVFHIWMILFLHKFLYWLLDLVLNKEKTHLHMWRWFPIPYFTLSISKNQGCWETILGPDIKEIVESGLGHWYLSVMETPALEVCKLNSRHTHGDLLEMVSWAGAEGLDQKVRPPRRERALMIAPKVQPSDWGWLLTIRTKRRGQGWAEAFNGPPTQLKCNSHLVVNFLCDLNNSAILFFLLYIIREGWLLISL